MQHVNMLVQGPARTTVSGLAIVIVSAARSKVRHCRLTQKPAGLISFSNTYEAGQRAAVPKVLRTSPNKHTKHSFTSCKLVRSLPALFCHTP